MKKSINTIAFSLTILTPALLTAEEWSTATQEEWTANKSEAADIELKDGLATPSKDSATFKSILKSFSEKRSVASITISQSPIWQNWNPIKQVGPSNLADAPVALRLGDGDYWLFGRYGGGAKGKGKLKNGQESFDGKAVELEGFDIPLTKSKFPNQYDAQGGLKRTLGGYHAWQSKDMVNWVHHGPVSDSEAKWMTTAEHVDGKAYLYYDFPNDQDPHLIIDDNLTDGEMGQKMGMAFKDPSNGSDIAMIRDLDGRFHIIYEDWSCINASKRSWDSPLAGHAVSEDGIKDFKIVDPAVDYRTEPTGKFAKFYHPHWNKDDPENYPSEETTEQGNGHKKGDQRAVAKYEVHQPEQEAYGDWASISIGGQYYLFGDYDPVGAHGRDHMKTVWFTSSDINKPFTKCDVIGKGHPDPDIMFAEGQFYIISQTDDFVSPGPWVDGVEVRVGVDTDNDKKIDSWTNWANVKETYSGTEGFSKQVTKTPATLDLRSVPEGFGFQYEVRLTNKTKNKSKPILDKVVLKFG